MLPLKYHCLCILTLSRNELIRTFIMDGNFSAEHMRCRTGETEVPLSSGMAFMADPVSYNAHLSTAKDVPPVSDICIYVCQSLPNVFTAQYL